MTKLLRPPGPGYFSIESPKLIGYRVSLVSVSESGSQIVEDAVVNVPNSLRISSTRSTTSQKTKKSQKLKNITAFVSEHCASFRPEKNWTVWVILFFVKILFVLSHISKTKDIKIGNLFFHSFQNIAQLLGTKTQFGNF